MKTPSSFTVHGPSLLIACLLFTHLAFKLVEKIAWLVYEQVAIAALDVGDDALAQVTVLYSCFWQQTILSTNPS